MFSRNCCKGSCSTEYRDNYRDHPQPKYRVSGLHPVHFITGESVFNLPPKVSETEENIFLRCEKPLWERLCPIGRKIHASKTPESRQFVEEPDLTELISRRPNRFLADLEHQYPDLYEKVHSRGFRKPRMRRSQNQYVYGAVQEAYEGSYDSSPRTPTPIYGHWV